MELRDALRMLRSEAGLTQIEFAAAINVGYSAASRWENQNTRPNRASSAAILALAKQRGVSAVCLDALSSILLASRANDRAEKKRIDEVTERLKLEERVLLSGGQMKMTLDNLDLAVIGHRIYSASLEDASLFYFNKRYLEMFGYDNEEFEQRSAGNLLFAISEECREECRAHLRLLFDGKTHITDSKLTVRCSKRSGEKMWLEIKGVSLNRFSYGWELFTSCRDVTKSVEDERRFAEEVVVRDASLQGFYASLHCDLETNMIFRHRDIEKVTGRELNGETYDDVLSRLAQAAPAGDGRDALMERFSRNQLLEVYLQGDGFGSVKVFNTAVRRWMRVDHVLLKNPYTEHIEAAIYIYDIHDQVLSTRLMEIFAVRFFEYIGIIDNQNESFEGYFCSNAAFKDAVLGKRDYKSVCEEKLRLYADPDEYGELRRAVSLDTVRDRLGKREFYSTFLNLRDYDGQMKQKKVTYTYLDETRSTIVVAQGDTADMSKTILGETPQYGTATEKSLTK